MKKSKKIILETLAACVAFAILFFVDNPFTKIWYKISGSPVRQEKTILTKELPQVLNQPKINPEPWSNEMLADSFFVKGKKEASFSAKINDKLPEFTFKIVGSFKEDHPPYVSFLAQHVEIINTSKKGQQILKAKNRFDNHGDGWDAKFDFELANIVEFVDMNFDGYLDLRLLYNTGATGNNWYATYLFNPSKGEFVYHEELSKLSGMKIDEKFKQIITYDREGACAEISVYYEVMNNKLVLSKAEWSEIDRRRDEEVGGFGCFMYTGTPRHPGLKIDPERFLYPEDIKDGGSSYIRKIMKNIKEEPLNGSLDGRERGPLGNPI